MSDPLNSGPSGITAKKLKPSPSAGKRFQESWLQDFNWVEKTDDQTQARCRICNKVIKAGKSELKKHEKGQSHKNRSRAINFQSPVTLFSNEEKQLADKVKTAEIKLSLFFAEHNVPIHTIGHFIELLKTIVDDSKIIKNISLKRTKCSEILKNVIVEMETNNLTKILQTNNFSILIDESTDISSKKNLCVLARYLDPQSGKIQTRLLELININAVDCSTDALYKEFKECLSAKNIPLHNIIAMGSDNCNTMVGQHSSFYTKLKGDVPNLILLGCLCHSIALVSSKCCEQLARSPEELLRSTVNYVSGSAKRCSELIEMQNFFHAENKKLLRLCTTRWLSRHACITRFLDNYEVLRHYFQTAVFEDKLKSSEFILQELNNDFNKAYLYFLKFALQPLTAFNAFFQSRNVQVHVLYEKCNNIMKQLCHNFLKLEIVMEKNLGTVNLENPSNYLPLEKMCVGTECKAIINSLPANGKHEFKLQCLNFYKVAAQEMQKKLPLSNNIFREMSFLDVQRVYKNKLFQLHNLPKYLGDQINFSEFETEWRNLKISFDSIADNTKNLPVDQMWNEIKKIKASDTTSAFPNVCKLAELTLIIPHSNAESERIFSIVSDVKIKKKEID